MLNFKSELILIAIVALAGDSAVARQPQLPGFFVENHGQAPPDVRFVMRRSTGTAYFDHGGVTIELAKSLLSIKFVKSSPDTVLESQQKLRALGNFFQGNNSVNWRSDVGLFEKLVYRDLWPGINAVYATSSEGFKSEFRLKPGSDPRSVRWSYGKEAHVEVEADGTLVVRQGGEIVRETVPVIYQLVRGRKLPISGAYAIDDEGNVGFTIEKYDTTCELVIDPVIIFTSFLGGGGQDAATSVATDALGNIVLVGYTNSTNFPAKSASFQSRIGGSTDAFVAKFGEMEKTYFSAPFLEGAGMIELWVSRWTVPETSISLVIPLQLTSQ